MTTRRIMVATDGGTASVAALDWVIGYARTTSVDVNVVTVEETDLMPLGSSPEQYRGISLAHLDRGSERLANVHGISSVSSTVLSGVPSRELADASEVADLLVVGSRPTTFLSSTLRTTLALRLAPHCSCPLIVVAPGWESRSGDIVVGVDDDGSSDSAIEFAAHEAERSGRALTMVHAWQPVRPFAAVARHDAADFPTLERLHQTYLDAAADRARGVAGRIRITRILQFRPGSRALVTAAGDASLVVVGTHRYGFVPDLFLGGTCRAVLAEAICPVAVVNSGPVAHRPLRGLAWEETAKAPGGR